MTPSVEVIVIGGGAVGAACAREIASRGRGVLIIDRGTDEGQAWRAAAGMLAAQTDGGGEAAGEHRGRLGAPAGWDRAGRPHRGRGRFASREGGVAKAAGTPGRLARRRRDPLALSVGREGARRT